MLQSTVVHEGVRSLEDRVIAEWSFTEDGGVRSEDFLQPAESPIASCGGETRSGIEGEANPLCCHESAIERKSSDVKRVIGQVMIVRSGESVCAGCRIHSCCDAPGRLGADGHPRGPVETAAHWIEKDVGAVEEREVGRGPGNGPIDCIGEISEGNANRACRSRRYLPRLVIEFSPRELRAVRFGGEL